MSISKISHSYIERHSHIKTALATGLINFSALAREICEHTGISSTDAVLMACRRYPLENLERSKLCAAQITELIKGAKLTLRTKIIVATIDKRDAFSKALNLQTIIIKNKGVFRLIEGEETVSIITTDDYLTAVTEMFKTSLLRLNKDLTQISMSFSEKITTTAGVCARLYNLLADNNINICEEMSCWTEVMIVVKSSDSTKVIELIQG